MKIEEQISLRKYTSLHVGGPADYFVMAHNDEEVHEALQFSLAHDLPFFILGKGSNTLFTDVGFRGVVILMADRSITHSGVSVTASSGVFMRQLVNYCLDHELRGLEELAGIPGTVGGAVRGNGGTWSTEIGQRVTSVDILECSYQKNSIQKRTLTTPECEFGYRDSIFKRHPLWVILRTTLSLESGPTGPGQELVQKDLVERHARQPYDAPSAGSIFKNPDKKAGIYSAALIEKLGLKGTRIGGAEISTKHANFILNRGNATSNDIRQLMELATNRVKSEFNITLIPEIEIVPEKRPIPSISKD